MGGGQSGGTRARTGKARGKKGGGGGGSGGGLFADAHGNMFTEPQLAKGQFGPSKARTLFTPGTSAADQAAAMTEAKRLFGERFTLQDFASASGAPDTAKVIVEYDAAGGFSLFSGAETGTGRFRVTVTDAKLISMERTFMRNAKGQPVIHNDIFKASVTGSGFGLVTFARQAENATKLGFAKIDTYAARGEDASGKKIYNGYYTWARFGYNAKLDHGDRYVLPRNLRDARSLDELFKTKEGRDYWKAKGDSKKMRFNLAPNSRSQRRLAEYVKDQGH